MEVKEIILHARIILRKEYEKGEKNALVTLQPGLIRKISCTDPSWWCMAVLPRSVSIELNESLSFTSMIDKMDLSTIF